MCGSRRMGGTRNALLGGRGWRGVVREELIGVEQVEWARRQTNWWAGHEWKIGRIVQSRSLLAIDE